MVRSLVAVSRSLPRAQPSARRTHDSTRHTRGLMEASPGVRAAVSALRQNEQIDKLVAWQFQRSADRHSQLMSWAREYCATDNVRSILMGNDTTLRYKPPGTRLAAITPISIDDVAQEQFHPCADSTPDAVAVFEDIALETLHHFTAVREKRAKVVAAPSSAEAPGATEAPAPVPAEPTASHEGAAKTRRIRKRTRPAQ